MAEALTLEEELEFMLLEEESSDENEEELLTCPYDSTHKMPKSRMAFHLEMETCRQRYRQKMASKGESVMRLSCKHNHEHQVDAPELLLHEELCEDGKKVWSYQVNISQLKDYFDFDFKPEDYEADEEELAEMYEGLYLDAFIGADTYGKAVPFDELATFRKAAHAPFEMHSQLPSNPEPEPSTSKMGAKTSKDVDEDDEDWTKDSNHPSFDYMQNLQNPTKPMYRFPPGLNKSQRRQFVDWNKDWMTKLLGKPKDRESSE